MAKVAFVGAGNVGSTAALYTAELGLADIVMIDVVEGLAEGKALDLAAAAGPRSFSVKISGTTDMAAVEGADVIVTTAGLARKPGMSRMDLLKKNVEIMSGIASVIAEKAPYAVIINVTNPLDVITECILRVTGFPRERVIGMAGVLDSGRFRAFLAAELGVSPRDVSAMVLGGHGDEMVPLVSSATVGGVPLTDLIEPDALERIVDRTRKAGAEVVALLKTGSAYVSPAASAVEMVKAVLLDERRILPAAVHLEGEYGYSDVCLGVPVVLGRNGFSKIVELTLSAEERQALDRSVEAVSEGIAELG